ncbi:MAG: copper homeostasis protein CutC [Microscillaceae bacterium]|jgi:copper homeostasis protein|nr:copper homeostasis protein CutC [Microscillaceae bacterium]
MQKNHLEICAFGIQSCLIAQAEGASRVELCDNPIEGGTTPSYGTIKMVREKISIELYPIIRPRSLNYYYDDDEWAIICQDVLMCKQLACDGISVGVQKINGELDTDKMKRLVDLAYPMAVTCNRVFDAVPNPYEALEQLIAAGCRRVLTSGQAATAPEGMNLLKELVAQAQNRLSVMPGAGVKSSNIAELKNFTQAYEFHASARIAAPNLVNYYNFKITDAGNMYIADNEEVRKMLELLKS